jgi:aminopeptidase-like protein
MPSVEFTLLNNSFDELWPLTRSITGPGIEQSLDYFSQYMPLKMEKVSTGTKVFDWVVPQEWHFQYAELKGPEGETICCSNDSNLHVVNYSLPVDMEIDLDELQKHLHSLPSLPTATPYVTSYYQKTWGFCLSEEKRLKLKPGKYHAQIKSSFKDGGVPFSHCTLEGESDKEILLTSYLCHPSLANNELSGPLTLLALYNRIKLWPKRRFTYRFLFNPETIGSLCFLSRYNQHLQKKLISGLILTCIGGPKKKLRYKESATGKSLFDKIAQHCSQDKLFIGEPLNTIPFSPLGGSDERQYGSPGFRLPMGQMSKTTYGEYDAYHNSLDDKAFMTIQSLIDSATSIEKFLQYGELCGKPINQSPYGEPQLGPRGLYPNMNSVSTRKHSADKTDDGRTQLDRILMSLNKSDGNNDLFSIADACQCSVDELIPIILKLENEGLISYIKKAPAL